MTDELRHDTAPSTRRDHGEQEGEPIIDARNVAVDIAIKCGHCAHASKWCSRVRSHRSTHA